MPRSESPRKLCAAQETSSQAGGSFFLYEKSVLRESNYLCGRKRKVCTDLTPPLSALQKPLKKMGFQRDASTMRRQRRISEFGEAEFLGAS